MQILPCIVVKVYNVHGKVLIKNMRMLVNHVISIIKVVRVETMRLAQGQGQAGHIRADRTFFHQYQLSAVTKISVSANKWP